MLLCGTGGCVALWCAAVIVVCCVAGVVLLLSLCICYQRRARTRRMQAVQEKRESQMHVLQVQAAPSAPLQHSAALPHPAVALLSPAYAQAPFVAYASPV